MKIKENYIKLQKKYKLPKFEELDDDFEINSIEKDEFLLREVRRKITEKIELYIKFLDSVLQIEPTIAGMHEIKSLNEEEKEKAYELYKKLMILDRLSIETSINEDNKKTSEFIKDAWKQWGSVKHKFLTIVKKLKESWKLETELKQELSYMG